MALVIADRVKETTTTSGTSDFVLAGAVTGFSTFSSVLSNSDTTYYVCVDGSNFEVGLGTFVSGTTTLQRTTVLASTNSNNKVSFSSSAKEVFITYPADKAVFIDGTGDISVTGNINFGDDDRAVFGAGSDLQIYHDGSNSYISESGTGNLFLGATNLFMRSSTGETYIGAVQDGAVTLYHNNVAKLATTSTGVDVTGTVTADGLDVQGDGTISGGSRLTISDIADVNNDGIRLDDNTTGRFNNLTQDTSGNFKIQHWTGSAWQNNFTLSTAGKLGLGTTSPSTTLDVAGNVSLGTNSSNTITLTGSIDLGTL